MTTEQRLRPAADDAVAARRDPGLPGRARRSRRAGLAPRSLWVPAVAFLFLVTQLPFLLTIFYSLRSWNLLRPDLPKRWVGLENYGTVLSDPSLLSTIGHTVVLTASVVVGAVIVGGIFALLLDRSFRGRGFVRTLLITPMLIMPVVTGLIWKNMMLHPVYGVVPWLLPFGGDVDLLAKYPMATVVAISIWTWTPFAMLILLSGLSAQDRSVLDAARVDGASLLQQFRYVTWPHLSSYVMVTVLLGVLLVLPTFDIIFVATGGGPGYATTNLAYAVYKVAFANYDIGVSSALALLNAAFSILTATLLIKVMGRIFVRGEALA